MIAIGKRWKIEAEPIFAITTSTSMLKNIVIFVNNIDTSLAFYKDILGLEPKAWNEGNVVLAGGLVLQEVGVWECATGEKVAPSGSACMLYFEELDLTAVKVKLKACGIAFEESNKCNPAGKAFIRFKDLDGHLIEVAQRGRA